MGELQRTSNHTLQLFRHKLSDAVRNTPPNPPRPDTGNNFLPNPLWHDPLDVSNNCASTPHLLSCSSNGDICMTAVERPAHPSPSSPARHSSTSPTKHTSPPSPLPPPPRPPRTSSPVCSVYLLYHIHSPS